MKAVIRAILTDSEARDDSALSGTSTGKLREPILRLTGWARAFAVNSPANTWPFGDTSSQSTRIGQSPGRSPPCSTSSAQVTRRPPPRSPQQGWSRPNSRSPTSNRWSPISITFQALIANGVGRRQGRLHRDPDQGGGQLSAGRRGQCRARRGPVERRDDRVDQGGGRQRRPRPRPTARSTAWAIAILLTMASPDYLTVK